MANMCKSVLDISGPLEELSELVEKLKLEENQFEMTKALPYDDIPENSKIKHTRMMEYKKFMLELRKQNLSYEEGKIKKKELASLYGFNKRNDDSYYEAEDYSENNWQEDAYGCGYAEVLVFDPVAEINYLPYHYDAEFEETYTPYFDWRSEYLNEDYPEKEFGISCVLDSKWTPPHNFVLNASRKYPNLLFKLDFYSWESCYSGHIYCIGGSVLSQKFEKDTGGIDPDDHIEHFYWDEESNF